MPFFSSLLDDEPIRALCAGKAVCEADVLGARDQAVAESVLRNNPVDDLKSAAGTFYTAARRLLGLTQAGGDTEAFLRDTMAPLLRRGMTAYDNLKTDIFGSP